VDLRFKSLAAAFFTVTVEKDVLQSEKQLFNYAHQNLGLSPEAKSLFGIHNTLPKN
jgi:hypothetical protein